MDTREGALFLGVSGDFAGPNQPFPKGYEFSHQNATLYGLIHTTGVSRVINKITAMA